MLYIGMKQEHKERFLARVFSQNILIEKRVLANEFDPVKCALLLSGLVKADDQKILRVRNAIYRNIFDSFWVRAVQLRMQQGGETQ